MNHSVLTLVIFCSICIWSSSAGNTTQAECAKLGGSDCQTCLANLDCGYCQPTKQCFLYRLTDTIEGACKINDLKIQTCLGNFKVWIIVVAVVAGVVLLTILIVICCLCRKCKRRSIRREERRQDRQQQQFNQQTNERETAAAARTADRANMADQLRMKYGILKEKENNDYSRLP